MKQISEAQTNAILQIVLSTNISWRDGQALIKLFNELPKEAPAPTEELNKKINKNK